MKALVGAFSGSGRLQHDRLLIPGFEFVVEGAQFRELIEGKEATRPSLRPDTSRGGALWLVQDRSLAPSLGRTTQAKDMLQNQKRVTPPILYGTG